MSIGALIYHARSGDERSGLASVALIVGVIAWYVGANSLHGWITKDSTSELGAGLATFVIFLTMVPDKIIPRVFTFLGDISYPLYCVHLIIIPVCFYFLTGHVPQLLVTLLPVAISLGVATLIHYTIEAPTNAMGKRLAYRWMARRAVRHINASEQAAPLPSNEARARYG
ncbi:hypothetical protein [Hyphomicrobium sp.]|uniref:acyltransferase family protein n=1 Tax=Hyphomicrobium sp. TaxID=82 RepID=UPI002D770972|nr:hypothetical protein [Hyphomicrobium sp.]HET6391007.1 hypothetical protein [Hyphomicrobium sp.]